MLNIKITFDVCNLDNISYHKYYLFMSAIKETSFEIINWFYRLKRQLLCEK